MIAAGTAPAVRPGSVWRVWAARIRARRVLAGLHPDQIREAGLDPHAVRAEAMKPFWRP